MHRTAGYSSESKGTGTGGGGLAPLKPKGLAPLKPLGGVKPPRGGKLAPLETTVKALSEEQMSAAKFQFDAYDSDSSGTISAAELRNLLQALDLTFTDDVFEAYARTTFREADRDLSGALDWNEFLKVYSSIIYESRKSGFSFADWKKSKTS